MTGLASILGFAAKAGVVIAGTAGVEAAIKRNRVQLVICAADLSPKTIKNFRFFCERQQIQFYSIGSTIELGKWFGRPGRGVFGIASAQFARAIQAKINEDNGVIGH